MIWNESFCGFEGESVLPVNRNIPSTSQDRVGQCDMRQNDPGHSGCNAIRNLFGMIKTCSHDTLHTIPYGQLILKNCLYRSSIR